MKLIRRYGNLVERAKVDAAKPEAAPANDRAFDFICSTAAEDSYGECIDQASWKLDRYKANPVVLYLHEWLPPFLGGEAPLPIGKAENVRVEDDVLKATIVIADDPNEDALCNKVCRLLQQGVLRAVSVGFRPGKIEDETDNKGNVTRTTLSECELHEISVVPLPANPEAVMESKRKAFGDVCAELRTKSLDPSLVERGAVKPASEPVVEDEWESGKAKKRIAKWASSDGSGDKDKIDWSKYHKGFAWFDDDEPDSFGGSKLPHHDVKDSKLVTVKAGVIAAGNAVQGSRGGVDIPDADMDGVKKHLANHYKQMDMTPPWEKVAPAPEKRAEPAAAPDTEPTPDSEPMEANACKSACEAGAVAYRSAIDAAAVIVETIEETEHTEALKDFAEVVANECREATAYALVAEFACAKFVEAMAAPDDEAMKSAVALASKAMLDMRTKLAPAPIVATHVEPEPAMQPVEHTPDVAVIASAVRSALSLADDADGPAITKSLVSLTSKAARADELEPLYAKALADLATVAKSAAEREVKWLVANGKSYGHAYSERSVRALMAYRTADPKGFAEDHAGALAGLAAFDDCAKLFALVTAPVAGATCPDSPAATAVHLGDNPAAEIKAKAEQIQREEAAKGHPISYAAAVRLVGSR